MHALDVYSPLESLKNALAVCDCDAPFHSPPLFTAQLFAEPEPLDDRERDAPPPSAVLRAGPSRASSTVSRPSHSEQYAGMGNSRHIDPPTLTRKRAVARRSRLGSWPAVPSPSPRASPAQSTPGDALPEHPELGAPLSPYSSASSAASSASPSTPYVSPHLQERIPSTSTSASDWSLDTPVDGDAQGHVYTDDFFARAHFLSDSPRARTHSHAKSLSDSEGDADFTLRVHHKPTWSSADAYRLDGPRAEDSNGTFDLPPSTHPAARASPTAPAPAAHRRNTFASGHSPCAPRLPPHASRRTSLSVSVSVAGRRTLRKWVARIGNL